MKTLKLNQTNIGKTIVSFHIGRGGKYWNAGHKSYIGEKKLNEFTFDFFLNWEYQCEITKKIGERENLRELLNEACESTEITPAYTRLSELGLDLGELYYTNSNGANIISYEDVESGVGVLDEDGEYNTTICRHLDECDENELLLIFNDYLGQDLCLDYLRERDGYMIDVLNEFELIKDYLNEECGCANWYGIVECSKEDYDNCDDDSVKEVGSKYYMIND